MRGQTHEELVAVASTLSSTILWEHAADVDRRGRFPIESVGALRRAGFLGWCLATQHGGLGGTVSTFRHIAGALGAGCPSSALIWVMHCQHVAVMSRYGAPASVLRDIAQGALVASATTEAVKGGELMRADAPLVTEGRRFRLVRAAPVVSYGEAADLFLLSARASDQRPATDMVMVVGRREDGKVEVTGGWTAMGMRGTRSISMSFDLSLEPAQVLSTPGRTIALQTMIPWGHIGWAAVWLGAAQGALSRFVKRIREPDSGHRIRATSDRFLDRLARIRMSLELGETFVTDCARQVDQMLLREASLQDYEDVTFRIRLNNVKAAAASLAFEASNGLLELAGLHDGYLEGPSGLERLFRDLRSASLMYHNDRLMEANGKLQLIEGTRLLGGLGRREPDTLVG